MTQLAGYSGVVPEVDPARNLFVTEWERAFSVGGEYCVAGGPSAVLPISFAANSAVMAMRFSASSTRKAYVTSFRVMMAVAAAALSGLTPTVVAIQRFTAATPTGGTARTVDKKNASHPSTSDMTDVRDGNAALTVTGVTFGDVLAQALVPNGSTNVVPLELAFAPDQEPVILAPGDGLCLRTVTAGNASATWVFSYTVHWYEK